MALGEFALIQRYFQRATSSSAVLLGIGDDAALLQLPADQVLTITTDTLVAGRHFPVQTSPYDIGWKALAVNLSDLAAMSATPQGFTLNLCLPEADEHWLSEFARGLFALADCHHCPLIGGDTTRGPLVLSITALGAVAPAQALRRQGAMAGDLLCVSGSLGDAGAGLALALAKADAELAGLANDHKHYLSMRLQRPEPRVALGQLLRGRATAAMDVSDGLLQDIGHLLRASGVGARLAVESLPMSPALAAYASGSAAARAQARRWALSAGDDYELLFTWPSAERADLERLMAEHPLSVIGEIGAEPGLHLTLEGQPWDYEGPQGFQHF